MRQRKHKRDSKYVGREFDNGWVCTGINIAYVASGKRSGGRTYWYAFERKTSDGKFDKWIRVSAQNAAKVWRGELTVEDISLIQEKKNSGVYKVNYQFSK